MKQMICPNDSSVLYLDYQGTFQCPRCRFNVPPNHRTIDTLYAWLSVDKSGMEGIMAVEMNGVMMVLVNSKKNVAENLEVIARKGVAHLPGYTTRLVEFKRVGYIVAEKDLEK